MLPWWVSAVLGPLAYIALAWVIPSVFTTSPVLAGLAALSRSLAWLPLFVFGLIALVAYLKAKPKAGAKLAPFVVIEPISQCSANSLSVQFVPQQPAQAFTTWDIRALRALEWKRFELLCAWYYEATGFYTITQSCGADGGIDIKLFKNNGDEAIAIVQCKAWNTYSVGVKEIRELLGVMAHEKVRRGIFITTGSYTKDALVFGETNPIQLLDGAAFLTKILALSPEKQHSLLTYAFDGDYGTPTCPSCGIKMIKRESKRGPFWGCTGYPRCKSTIAISKLPARPVSA